MAMILASELRMHELTNTRTSSADDTSEFANSADKMVHVRRVDFVGQLSLSTGVQSRYTEQLSKATSFQRTSGSIPPTMQAFIKSIRGTTGTVDVSGSTQKSWAFERNQLTLETGEALHQHTREESDGSGVGSKTADWFIWWEF